MRRKLRLEYLAACFHVINRGNPKAAERLAMRGASSVSSLVTRFHRPMVDGSEGFSVALFAIRGMTPSVCPGIHVTPGPETDVTDVFTGRQPASRRLPACADWRRT